MPCLQQQQHADLLGLGPQIHDIESYFKLHPACRGKAERPGCGGVEYRQFTYHSLLMMHSLRPAVLQAHLSVKAHRLLMKCHLLCRRLPTPTGLHADVLINSLNTYTYPSEHAYKRTLEP